MGWVSTLLYFYRTHPEIFENKEICDHINKIHEDYKKLTNEIDDLKKINGDEKEIRKLKLEKKCKLAYIKSYLNAVI